MLPTYRDGLRQALLRHPQPTLHPPWRTPVLQQAGPSYHPIMPQQAVVQALWQGFGLSSLILPFHLPGLQCRPGGMRRFTSLHHSRSKWVILNACLCLLPRFLGALFHPAVAKPHHRVWAWCPVGTTQPLRMLIRRMMSAPHLASLAQGVEAGFVAVVLLAPAGVFVPEAPARTLMTPAMAMP